MRKKIFKTLVKAGNCSRGLRSLSDDMNGIAMISVFLIILLFAGFLIFVGNIVNIALGLAVIGIAFIIIAAGLNAIRNSLSKRKSTMGQWG